MNFRIDSINFRIVKNTFALEHPMMDLIDDKGSIRVTCWVGDIPGREFRHVFWSSAENSSLTGCHTLWAIPRIFLMATYSWCQALKSPLATTLLFWQLCFNNSAISSLSLEHIEANIGEIHKLIPKKVNF